MASNLLPSFNFIPGQCEGVSAVIWPGGREGGEHGRPGCGEGLQLFGILLWLILLHWLQIKYILKLEEKSNQNNREAGGPLTY